MIYIDVDTAIILPLNSFPLLDDTDFKTIETGLVYNSAGLVINWNFVTSAGVMTMNAITATTSGVFDITEPVADKGMYAIEMPASGQTAGSNNDREGYGWFTGVATGILPWSSPMFCFRAAALNDALVDGGDLLDVNAAQILGTAISNPATAGVLDINVKNMNNVAATSITAVNANQGTTQPVNFTGTGATAYAKTDVVDISGTAVSATTAQLGVNVVQISADATAADNAELFFDGTGYAGTNNVIPTVTLVTTTTNLTNLPAAGATAAELAKVPKSDSTVSWNATALAAINAEVDTALNTAIPASNTANSVNDVLLDYLPTVKVDTAAIKVKTDYLPSVAAGGAGGVFIAGSNAATSITTALTANITGNISGSVGSVAANGIGVTSIATDAITAATVKADAVTKIQTGLATSTELAKVPKSDSNVTFNATALASINAECDTAVAVVTALIGTPLDLGSGVATLAGNLTDIDTEVDGIAVTGAALNTLANGRTLTTGTETGAYTDTFLDNGVYHVITTVGTTIDLEYLFTLPNAHGVPTEIKIVGFLKEGSPAGGDTIALQYYNYTTPGWEVADAAIFTGITGTVDQTVLHAMFSRFVGTAGGDVGKIRIRFYSTTLETGTTLNIDQIYIAYAEAVSALIAVIVGETAKIPKSDSNVTWNATALASINAEVDTALNTAIPGSPTADSVNERIVAIDAYGTPPTALSIADSVWDEATSGHTTGGSTGAALSAATAPSATTVAYTVWEEGLAAHSSAGSAGLALSTASSGGVDPSVLADAIWDEAISGHATTGTTGKKLTDIVNADLSGVATSVELAKVPKSDGSSIWNVTALAAINTQSDLALSDVGLTATVTGRIDAAITSRGTGVALDAAGIRSAVGLATANLDTQIADVPTVAEMNARTIVSANYALDSTVAKDATVSKPGTAQTITPPADMALNSTVAKELTVSYLPTVTAFNARTLPSASYALEATINTKIPTALSFTGANVNAESKVTASPSDMALNSTVAKEITLATITGYIDTEVAAIKVVTDKLNTALVLDGAVYQYTANALELAPAGGGTGTAPTVEQIDTQLSSTHGSGLWGAGITGANSITFTITSAGAVPIPGVSVLILNADQTSVINAGTTDSLGVFSTSLDNGTYKIRLTKALVSFTVPETLVVDGTETVAYTGVLLSPTPPATGLQLLYVIPDDGNLIYNSKVIISAQVISLNNVIDDAVITKQVLYAANSGTYWYLTLAIGGDFRIVGSLNGVIFLDKNITVTADSTRNMKEYI